MEVAKLVPLKNENPAEYIRKPDCLHEMILESGSKSPVQQVEGSSEEWYKIQGFYHEIWTKI